MTGGPGHSWGWRCLREPHSPGRVLSPGHWTARWGARRRGQPPAKARFHFAKPEKAQVFIFIDGFGTFLLNQIPKGKKNCFFPLKIEAS